LKRKDILAGEQSEPAHQHETECVQARELPVDDAQIVTPDQFPKAVKINREVQ
jgi:hypothetical protein